MLYDNLFTILCFEQKPAKPDAQQVLLLCSTLRTPVYNHVKMSSRRSKDTCSLTLLSRYLLGYNVSKRLYNHLSSSSMTGITRVFYVYSAGILFVALYLNLLTTSLFMGKPSKPDAQKVFVLRSTRRTPLYSQLRSSSSERGKGLCSPTSQARIYYVTLYVSLCTTSSFRQNLFKPDAPECCYHVVLYIHLYTAT